MVNVGGGRLYFLSAFNKKSDEQLNFPRKCRDEVTWIKHMEIGYKLPSRSYLWLWLYVAYGTFRTSFHL